ncbi:hypothetical protein SNARM312S_07098 [Streptomyces narbonensis]
MSAHAVWEAVEAPRPIHASSSYERRSSPQPPSSFWTVPSQRTARRTAGWETGSPAAVSAGSTEPVPYTWLTPQRPNQAPFGSWFASSHSMPLRVRGSWARPS